MLLSLAILLSIIGGIVISFFEYYFSRDDGTGQTHRIMLCSTRQALPLSTETTKLPKEKELNGLVDSENVKKNYDNDHKDKSKNKNHMKIFFFTIFLAIIIISLTLVIVYAMKEKEKKTTADEDDSDKKSHGHTWNKTYSKIDYDTENATNNMISISSNGTNGVYVLNDKIKSMSIHYSNEVDNHRIVKTYDTPYETYNTTFTTLSSDGSCFVKMYKNNPSGEEI